MQVVGVGSLFFWPAPVLLKQGYLVVTGVVTAYMFTFVPEWTTWTLLIAMALYDLYAVLVPGGPLKVPPLRLFAPGGAFWRGGRCIDIQLYIDISHLLPHIPMLSRCPYCDYESPDGLACSKEGRVVSRCLWSLP